MCPLAICRFFFLWIYLNLSASFELDSLFCYWVIEDLCYSGYMTCKCFLPFCDFFFFHSVVSAFWCRKYFNFDIINLSVLLIYSLWFCIIARKSVPNPKSWIFTPMIPSKTLLMFRSLIHLALTFCIWCKVRVQLHSFPDGTPVSRHCMYSFPCLGTGVEIQLTV